ncbi:glycosyltransferase [Mycobacterium sp. E740]|uniref:glycosyltransferase n=1 Tax=Mycobacterium sp. E740 TaxID=1834149 RepID=UPI0007FECBF7|nr:glycosyltransferase [Mycobacterium sp. E740]OBI72373.1 glycosyl transferase family 1 [Mycobacterium sp. E740]
MPVRESHPSAPSRPTRVLMVLDHFSFGGAENLVAELGLRAPASLSISAASLAPPTRNLTELFGRLAEAGLNPTYLNVSRLLDVVGFARLVRTLRRAPVDVVHAHLGYSAVVVTLASYLARKPVVATLHLSPQRHSSRAEWLKERLSVRVPERFGRLVLVSQHAFDEYARLHGPARRTWRMIPNGVDTERFNIGRTGDSPGGPVWACVAALRPDKNHGDLLRSWAAVVAAHPDATLLIVGDGPARPDIERAISELGLADSVTLLGRREDVADILATVDGVVSASVDEALPTALIEAAACGLPVVATDAGGTREIVVNDVTGRLVPLRDVDALTEALLSTIGDPVRAAGFGRAGRALVEQKYSLDRWVENLNNLYAEVRGAV